MTKFQRKKELREELRQRIALNEDGDSLRVVREIAAYLEERPNLRIVAVFSPLPGEVDLRTLCSELDRVWVFPKVAGEEIWLYPVKSFEEDMLSGAYGIKEPKQGLEEMSVEKVDLFLCPGLGFDMKGGRVGRGKGYYDRLLEQARPGAVKLGICFAYQLVDEVEMEDHDIRMDGVITG